MEDTKVNQAIDRSLTECARRLLPVMEEVIKTTLSKEHALPEPEASALGMRMVKTVLRTLNVGIDSRIVITVLHVVVKTTPPRDEDWNIAQDPYIVGMLPLYVTSQLPMAGDIIAMDDRIPPELHPMLVARRFHPFSGGHVVLHMKLFCPSEQIADDTWALYQKFMGAELKFHKNQPTEEANGPQEASQPSK